MDVSPQMALASYLDEVEIIDTHEHLPLEAVRTGGAVDFATLFSHYCLGDMIAAGLSDAGLATLQDPAAPVPDKWAVFAPFYDRIKNGAYARAARIGMERFYGLPDLRSLEDAETVTERIRRANTPGIYKRILWDACRIQKALLFTNDIVDDPLFGSVDCLDHLTRLNHIGDLNRACGELGDKARTLGDYVALLQAYMQQKAARGVKGIKFTTAYYRSLDFTRPSSAEAEGVFNKILSPGYLLRVPLDRGLDAGDVNLLQDYLILRVLDECERLGLPAVFHTGLQAGNRNNPASTRPEPLWHLFYTYPGMRFVLLHGGLPWTDETAMLVKSYPNVYVDMAWMHIISPEIAARALSVWIDMLPKNKILGFGGDYLVPEKVYGHLVMAKENIARALGAKIADGTMTEGEACSWIDHLLRRNAVEVYGV